MNSSSVVSVVGQTASGKTALSLDVARKLNGEIVNLDAYQIYRGMDIGTAKASAAERAEVPHHLVDIVDIDHRASVSDFQEWARTAIREINGRGKPAICVGGAGLYVKAVLENMDFPATDESLRTKYETMLSEIGPWKLHALLAEKDPAAAAAIVPGNSRRVVRALEVMELTGQPFTATLPTAEHLFDDSRIGLSMPREELIARITARVDVMWSAGWVDEVRQLAERGLAQTPTASKALGYSQIIEMLAGELSEAACKEAILNATVRYSRRQMQWFRRDEAIRWFAWDREDLLEQVLASIATAS